MTPQSTNRISPCTTPFALFPMVVLAACNSVQAPTGAFTYVDDRGGALEGHLIRSGDGFNGDVRGSSFSFQPTIIPQLSTRPDGWVDVSIDGVTIHSLRPIDEQTVQLATGDGHYLTLAFDDGVAHLHTQSSNPKLHPQVVGVDDIIEWGALVVAGLGAAGCAAWDAWSCGVDNVNWNNWSAYDISSGYSIRYCSYSCSAGGSVGSCRYDGETCQSPFDCCYSDCSNGICSGVATGTTCLQDGASCSSYYKCCSSNCNNGICGGGPTCEPDGASCDKSSQCCNSNCTSGVCGGSMPTCYGSGHSCDKSSQCCNYDCSGGVCGGSISTCVPEGGFCSYSGNPPCCEPASTCVGNACICTVCGTAITTNNCACDVCLSTSQACCNAAILCHNDSICATCLSNPAGANCDTNYNYSLMKSGCISLMSGACQNVCN